MVLDAQVADLALKKHGNEEGIELYREQQRLARSRNRLAKRNSELKKVCSTAWQC